MVQPFFFVCDRCKTPVRAALHIWYEPEPGARLELEEGEPIEDPEEGPDQVFNIHPDFPSIPDAKCMASEGGSPFIHQHALVGEHMMDVMERMRMFRQVMDDDWSPLRMLAGFYTRRDWERFDAHGRELLKEAWPEDTTALVRHDCFHRLILLAFRPLLVPGWIADAVAEFNLGMNADPDALPVVARFCRLHVASGSVAQFQEDLIDRLDYVARNKGSLLAVLPLEFYPDGSEEAIRRLRLFRDDFDMLKTHYIDTYELAHKILTLLVGYTNCLERGSPDNFDNEIQRELAQQGFANFRRINSLDKFDKLSNGPKKAFLGALPTWKEVWEATLDPPLRNAIGHHDARHDLREGQILTRNLPPISYIDFAFKTMRLTHVIIMLLHAMKMFCVVDLLGPREDA